MGGEKHFFLEDIVDVGKEMVASVGKEGA